MPLPDAQAEPQKPPDDPMVWTTCPDCKSPEHTFIFGKLTRWSMEQICLGCGSIGPDLHFTAQPGDSVEEKIMELKTKEKAA